MVAPRPRPRCDRSPRDRRLGARRPDTPGAGGSPSAARRVSGHLDRSALRDARLLTRCARRPRAQQLRRRSPRGQHARRPRADRRAAGASWAWPSGAPRGEGRLTAGFFELGAELLARREPFATATVVRAERPTSAKPGAKAVITPDGRLVGWIGGSCAAPVVIREALAAIADGEARLIEISKVSGTPRPGVRHFPMTCHSGGTLEIHIEPLLPSEQLVIVGRTPVARALAALGSALGRHVIVAEPDVTAEDFPTANEIVPDLLRVRIDDRTAVVVAARGDADEDPLAIALRTSAAYVGLVASRTRGDVVREVLAGRGFSAEELRRLVYPAGLDMGPLTDEEIALSILAQILSHRRARAALENAGQPLRMSDPAFTSGVELPSAVDVMCGMTVAITPSALSAEHEGTTYYFCSAGCRRRFLADPVAALAAAR